LLQITLDYIANLMAGRDIMLPAPAAAARPAGAGAAHTVQQPWQTQQVVHVAAITL